MEPRTRAAVFIIFLLAGHEAARIQQQAKQAEFARGTLNATTAAGGAAGRRALVEEGCRFDEEGSSRALALQHKSAWITEAQELGPDEYWSAEYAVDRCRTATTLRTVKVVVGAPIVLIVGQAALSFVVLTPAYAALVEPALSTVFHPFITNLGNLGSAVFTPLFSYAMNSPLYLTAGALSAVFGIMAGIYYVGGFLIAISLPASLFMTPIVVAMKGAERVHHWTFDIASRLLGYGKQYPSCCCAPGRSPSEESCVLVTASADAEWEDDCPPGWKHDATRCAVPEIVQYSEEQTVDGCHCKNSTECGTNRPHRGHAWCEVKEGKCGRSFFIERYRRWDYCRVDGRPLQFATGNSTAPNDALATFIPNRFTSTLLPSSPDDAFRLGTWVDAGRGLATAKPSFFSWSQCFAGTAVETLSACARLCLEEGAPNAKTMANEADVTHKCVAFAYHRQLHTCVRLPDFAADAKFTPFLSDWNGDGWQNFVSKYHGRNPKTVCPADTLLKIRKSGYTVVRDKNNGHVYVQCANKDDIQKVSCLQNECEYKSKWCFVRNKCKSGTASWLGGCSRLTDAEALACSGEYGVIIPDNTKEQEREYWDARNALSRCSRANTIRIAKIVAAAPLLLLIGEVATISLLQEGFYARLVGNVFGSTFEPTGRFVYEAGLWLWQPFGYVMQALPILLLKIVWGALVGGFAVVYLLGGYLLAVSPTAAAMLTPILASFAGAQILTELTVDVVAKFVGYGAEHPICCCPYDNATLSGDGETRACAMTVAMSGGASEKCPKGFFQDASQCAIPEVVRYSDEQTVAGCTCANSTECSVNVPYRGHAWCHISGPSRCGHRSTLGKTWDYCRLDGKPLEYATGNSSARSDALATFIPNVFSRVDLLGPGHPFSLGTWTDAERGLTTASPSFFASRQCFAALPVETLGACAQSCLDEGAPNAKIMADPTESTAYPCVAFAYNRALNLCVRLPAFAADAQYTPVLRQWGGEGWQNFVSKYYGKSLQSSCPAMTLLDIRDKGYAVARDKNNGHLYLRCAGSNATGAATHKASCISKECGSEDATWCFVDKRCGGALNSCKRAKDQNPLEC